MGIINPYIDRSTGHGGEPASKPTPTGAMWALNDPLATGREYGLGYDPDPDKAPPIRLDPSLGDGSVYDNAAERFVNMEVFPAPGSKPRTWWGKTIEGARIEREQGGSVGRVFAQEYDREARDLWGVNPIAWLKRWGPVIVIGWLAVSLLAPVLSRSAASAVKEALA